MELISQAILNNSDDNEVSNLEQNDQRKKEKKKRKKRVLCLLVLMVFSFEILYIIVSKLTYEEIEKLLHYITSSNNSLHYQDS